MKPNSSRWQRRTRPHTSQESSRACDRWSASGKQRSHSMRIARRSFTCRTDESGALVFEGRLPPEQGALLLQALDRAMDWLFNGQPHRSRQQRDDARVEDMPQDVRRADAIAILAERFLAEPPNADEGINTADRYQLTVHAPAGALIEYGDLDPDDPPQIENGPVVAVESVRRIACDSALVRILESGNGEPLDIGRKTQGNFAGDAPCAETPRPWLSFSGLREYAIRRWSSHQTLGRWRSYAARQSRVALPTPPPAVTRRWLLRREGRRELHLL